MSKGKQSEVEMIGALKHLEAGRTVAEIGREVGVSQHAVYAWKAKFRGISVDEGQRLRVGAKDEIGQRKRLPERSASGPGMGA